jgi:hypothetical protein
MAQNWEHTGRKLKLRSYRVESGNVLVHHHEKWKLNTPCANHPITWVSWFTVHSGEFLDLVSGLGISTKVELES